MAEKTEKNGFIHIIKTKYQFQNDKIYKLEFSPNYKDNDFNIGFGDFSKASNVGALYVAQDSVCLTDKGLLINKKNVNTKITIENGRNYEFIIDMKKKKFNLYMNDENFGEYEFNFQNNVFVQASIRNIGNSVKIKTYEKYIES